MKSLHIVHVGPPLARTGGPAGYVLQLQNAALERASTRHDVHFPASAPPFPSSARPRPRRTRFRRAARAILGRPRQYRPTLKEMRRANGPAAELYRTSKRESCEISVGSLGRDGAHRDADVLFLHDPLAVDAVLADRGRAELWLMVHSPMPMGLYFAWNWGIPEAAWQEIAGLPDVQNAIEDELESWRRVDRLVFPCREALDEMVRVDARFGDVATPIDFVLTGSGEGCEDATDPPPSRRRFRLPHDEPVGVFLGNGLAYRGLDVVLEAAASLPSRRDVPGVIAVAGPDTDTLPPHPRLHRLGRVDDVPSLLACADFLVNTNRFCLFDLSNIEGAQAGLALLLHRTGGNKTLAELGAGCELFDELSPPAVADALTAMFATPREELERLGRLSRDCYLKHLTAEHMWNRHLDLYDRAALDRTPLEATGA